MHTVDSTAARLARENAALRRALARAQGVPPDQVKFELEEEEEGEKEEEGPFTPSPPVTSQPAPPAKQSVGQEAPESVPDSAASAAQPEVQPPLASAPRSAEDSPALREQLEAGIRWPQPDERPPFYERPARAEPLPLGSGVDLSKAQPDKQPLHIVHLTAEMAPIAKVGGLGDVVTGLARASLARGHTCEVMLPFYECLPGDQIANLQHDLDFDTPKGFVWDGRMQTGSLRTSVWRGAIDGVPVLLVRPDWEASNLFRGGRIYGGSYNELEAYLYFCRACLEYLRVSGRQPHVLHLHEWQCAAAAMLYWERYHHAGLGRPRLCFTIHNMDNSGECRQDEFAYAGLPGEMFATVDKALDERTIGHNPERLNLMKGGIIYSNAVTTVSPTYAEEALSGGAAGWLRSTLARSEVQSKFQGVLNGIDTAIWDPATDPLLPANFTPDNLFGKALCKRYLQQGLGLEVDPDKPMVACITRLVPQKGIHLIRAAIFQTLEQGGQFVLLGSGHADGVFRGLAEGELKGHPNARLLVMYSEPLAHQIYAAADIVAVPSMFEPCGLTQLVAMRYGAVPLVRATGGLADTVKDVDQPAEGGQQPNGFSFAGVDEGSLNSTLERALTYYKERREWWAELCRHNMQVDSSWERAAATYLDLYRSLAVDW